MKSKLTKKQKEFADEYLATGNGTQSALKAYDVNNAKTASVVASENLNKPSIIQYLEENARVVANNIVRLAISAESEQVQLAAGKDVLDRAGYKPVEKSINLNVQTEINNPEALALAQEYEEKLKKAL